MCLKGETVLCSRERTFGSGAHICRRSFQTKRGRKDWWSQITLNRVAPHWIRERLTIELSHIIPVSQGLFHNCISMFLGKTHLVYCLSCTNGSIYLHYWQINILASSNYFFWQVKLHSNGWTCIQIKYVSAAQRKKNNIERTAICFMPISAHFFTT